MRPIKVIKVVALLVVLTIGASCGKKTTNRKKVTAQEVKQELSEQTVSISPTYGLNSCTDQTIDSLNEVLDYCDQSESIEEYAQFANCRDRMEGWKKANSRVQCKAYEDEFYVSLYISGEFFDPLIELINEYLNQNQS